VLEQEPHAGSSASVVLDLAQAGVKFLETHTTQPRLSMWTGDCLIESIALDAEVVRGQARKPVVSVRSRASFSTQPSVLPLGVAMLFGCVHIPNFSCRLLWCSIRYGTKK